VSASHPRGHHARPVHRRHATHGRARPGHAIPRPLLRALRRTDGSDDSIRRVGVHWATEQSRDLLDHGVAGIHFYTLNKSNATVEIYRTLGVAHSGQLREDHGNFGI
jgi:5,10-methylenetetrahydrofolate reductase